MTPAQAIKAAKDKGLQVEVRKTASDVLGMINLPRKSKGPEVRTATPIRWALEFSIPCRVLSPQRRSLNWRVLWKRGKEQGEALREALFESAIDGGRVRLPVIVTWTHIGPEMDKDENLPWSFKALKDHMASWLGLPNDRDPRVEWRYQQRRGQPGVEVRIESRQSDA